MREKAKQWLYHWSGVLSTAIICLGVCTQTWRIVQLGSSLEISMTDLVMRSTASALWLVQYHLLKNRKLIWCQRSFLMVYGIYVFVVIYYRLYPASSTS